MVKGNEATTDASQSLLQEQRLCLQEEKPRGCWLRALVEIPLMTEAEEENKTPQLAMGEVRGRPTMNPG